MSRKHREEELDEEIRAHLAMAARDRIERGEEPEAAELAARREFGNRTLVHDITREMWGCGSLERLWQDIRYALRGMRRSPGFNAVAVLSLGLGIGANTAIFSLVDAVMLRALPVEHPEQLVELLHSYPGESRSPMGGSPRTFAHFRDNNHVFSVLTGTLINYALVSTEGSEPERVIRESVIGNYFHVLGIKPAIGRLIAPDDEPDGTVAVVSWSYWKARFHLDPAIVGKRVVVDSRPLTIIGVAPRGYLGFQVGYRTDIWFPREHSDGMGVIFGRLKPGATLEQARAEVAVLHRFAIEEITRTNKDPLIHQMKSDVALAAAGHSRVRDRYGRPLLLLMSVVAVLLLIACINTASMLLARAAGRQRETAVRVGLGASRGRLVQQALTESLLLSGGGALLGLVLAHLGAGVLVRIIASGREHERFVLPVQLDSQTLAFTAAVALLTGVLFGLAPVLHVFRTAPASALRQAGGAGDTALRRLFGRGLVAAQVASSVLLLSAAGLFVGYVSQLKYLNLGFERDHVLLVVLDPARSGYTRAQLALPFRELLARLESIPGVRSASIMGASPIQGAGAGRIVSVEGYPQRPEERHRIAMNRVAPKYFETLGIPILAGRDFELQDEQRARVLIVNQSFARHYFAAANPIGRHVTVDGEAKPYEIVGMVGDAKYIEIRESPPRTMYFNMFQEGHIASQFALRTNSDPAAVAGDVRRMVRESVKNVPISRVLTLADQVDASIVPERLMATLSALFGALGSLLACIGVYGLLAYTVARRTNEIGIRMALGATQAGIARMVLRDALVTAGAGLALGVPLVYWCRHFAANLIPDLPVTSASPVIFAGAVMLALAMLAAYLPARRAASVDPMAALRHE